MADPADPATPADVVEQPATGRAGPGERSAEHGAPGAELVKLGRALGVGAAEVAFLERLPPEKLRVLRERVSASLFDRHRGGLQRMAAASRLLPIAVLAKIAARTMPPVLSAGIAAEMPPERAAELAARLEIGYLADVCVDLDPRRAAPIVAALPLPVVVAVAGELLRRNEHLTLGRFVDAAPDDVIHAVLATIHEAEPLLRIAFYVEDADQLTRVVDLLTDDRLRNLLLVGATAPDDLRPAALSLLTRVTPQLAARLAAVIAGLDDDRLRHVTNGLPPAVVARLEGRAQAG